MRSTLNLSLHLNSIKSISFRFGEDAVEKMVDWCLDNVPPSTSPSVLEIGSGNGTLLFGLVEAGYDAKKLAGIDYSAGAVKLAKGIAETRNSSDITFTQCDFLNDTPARLPSDDNGAQELEAWDLLLDKGTYDAIALGSKDEQGKTPTTGYPSRVSRILKPGGYFLITCKNHFLTETFKPLRNQSDPASKFFTWGVNLATDTLRSGLDIVPGL